MMIVMYGVFTLWHIMCVTFVMFPEAAGEHDGSGQEGHPGGGTAAAEGQRGETHGRGVCAPAGARMCC